MQELLAQRKKRLVELRYRRGRMKHLVEFPLEEGGSIVVEVDEPESAGTIRAARGDTIVKAKETLEEALNNVLPVTKSLVEKLRSIGNKPDEIGVTFGVSLNTAVGAVMASASAEANFSVTMHWSGKTEETTPQS
jgi:NTP-dependent ternary system trypsin peptidase co-occuring protein